MPALGRGGVILALVSVGGAARAHDTWLAGPPGIKPGTTALLDLTSSGAFPAPDHAIEVNRVARAACRVGGKDVSLQVGPRGRQALRLRARIADAGVATCSVTLGPRALDLDAEAVDHYLDEIGAKDRVGPLWRAQPPPRKWRETYVKHAKTLVRVGDTADEAWREPVGLGLEIVPLTDPTRLTPGSTLEVRLLKQGRPLAGLPLRALHPGRPSAFATTGEDGRASFVLDAAGPWLLAGTELRPSTARPSEWESDFTTLSLVVAP